VKDGRAKAQPNRLDARFFKPARPIPVDSDGQR
jgi:hypothetical protein